MATKEAYAYFVSQWSDLQYDKRYGNIHKWPDRLNRSDYPKMFSVIINIVM